MRQMQSSRIGFAEHKRNAWRCTLETGTTVEELLDPQFFVNITGLRPGDTIEVVKEDASGMALLLVREQSKTAVRVGLVVLADFSEQDARAAAAPAAPASDFRIDFNLEDKHRVVRLSDGAIVAKDLPTEAAAQKAMLNARKALA